MISQGSKQDRAKFIQDVDPYVEESKQGEDETAEFLEWLTSNGASFPGLEMKRYEGFERGTLERRDRVGCVL